MILSSRRRQLCMHIGGAVAAVVLLAPTASAEDWPTWRHDVRRSGHSREQLEASTLTQAWTHRATHPPRPAWGQPPKWDAYRSIRGLRSMRNFDPVSHPVVANGRVLLGSSTDDAVDCLEARSGETLWSAPADGPVRIAPTVHDGRVYFGADDGYAYCVRANDGSLLWRFSPTEGQPLVLQDGRLISRWPVRTGVLIEGPIAYFAASLLPWEDSYLCAVDARSGQPRGPDRFVVRHERLSLEGALAASTRHLVAPQGRVAPLLFRREDGTAAGSLKDAGGCFVVVTAQDSFVHGGGDYRTHALTEGLLDAEQTKVASYPNGNALVVADDATYVLTDRHLFAIDRRERRPLWQVPCAFPLELILAGQTLVAGGRDGVAAFDVSDGRQLWEARVDGDALGLAVADGALFVSTDEGVLHCFRAGTDEPWTPPLGDVTGTSFSSSSSRPATPAAIPSFEDAALLGRWVFQAAAFGVGDRPLARDQSLRGARVRDQTGRVDGTVVGDARLERVGEVDALVLDGAGQSVLLASNHTEVELPTSAISIEAWVRIDQSQAWGGILGAIQDNGDFEKGWLLGFRDDRFAFAVSTAQGGRLTYLTADQPLHRRRWHHVVGTYDGEVQRIFVDGTLRASSETQGGAIEYPPQAFVEIGAYHDDDEQFPITGALHEVRLYRRALDPEEVEGHHRERRDWFPAPLELAAGPWLEFTDPDQAVVRWETRQPEPTIFAWGTDTPDQEVVVSRTPTLHHGAVLGDLERDRTYRYVIRSSGTDLGGQSREYECDTYFNFLPVPVTRGAPGDAGWGSTAERIRTASRVDRGIAVVLGSGSGQLARELAARTRLHVIGVDDDGERVAAARELLTDVGAYGVRVTLHAVESLAALPFPARFADLIVTEEFPRARTTQHYREMVRLLQPGGVALLGGTSDDADFHAAGLAVAGLPYEFIERWVRIEGPPLEEIGEWTHQYGLPDNSGFGGESLGGARKSGDLTVQWIGRPGPRYQVDRQTRKPAPLAVNGRLFLQGLERILALDAYNGSILWSLELAGLLRCNVHRDSSNWCADADHLYAAIGDRCWQVDAGTGSVVRQHRVIPGTRDDWEYEWGYVARHRDLLLGSAVKKGSAYTEWWGGTYWYDHVDGPLTRKVCTSLLFALDPGSGETAWMRDGAAVIHSTITIADDRIYLIESRNPACRQVDSSRLGPPELWQDQFLVALDAATGSTAWERPLTTVPGISLFHLAHGGGRLVLVASQRPKVHVHAFDARDGSDLWSRDLDWPQDHHGGHLSRPMIVGERLFVRPAVLELASGEVRSLGFPGGHCGTYAASTEAVFYRAGHVTMWDPSTAAASSWYRLRPDCWLSTIPACGMLLSPEAGGGCSCATWLEASVGFLPVSASPAPARAGR